MNVTQALLDSFARITDNLPGVIDGLSLDELLWAPTPESNSIAWLAWHIGRCEDLQMAHIAGSEQVYTQGWSDKFALPYSDDDLGYGHTPEQVQAFAITDPSLLTDYYAATAARTREIIATLSEDDLDAAIPNDPYQATVGTRIISIINDITQHLGQVSYLRGVIDARR